MSPAYHFIIVIKASLAALLVALPGIAACSAYAQEGPAPTVSVRQDPALGPLLTDAQGWTLYIFTRDQPDMSTCTGQCAANWPPLTIEGDPVVPPDLPGTVGVVVRPDGARQVTYNGMPVYYFAGDAQPGETNGHGAGGVWFVARPAAALPAGAPPAETQPAGGVTPGEAMEQPQPQATPQLAPTPAPAPSLAATPTPPPPGYRYGYGY